MRLSRMTHRVQWIYHLIAVLTSFPIRCGRGSERCAERAPPPEQRVDVRCLWFLQGVRKVFSMWGNGAASSGVDGSDAGE